MKNSSLTAGHDFYKHPWLESHKRLLNFVFPGEKAGISLIDLGCFNGDYTVEFARMGFDSLGLEVREENFKKCLENKEKSRLFNLKFVRDTAWNVKMHGSFDVVFCSGLLYHLEKPAAFLEILSEVTKKILIVQTHFSLPENHTVNKYALSPLTVNEGLPGRWFNEGKPFNEGNLWASWENATSFWLQKEFLIGKIRDCGFDIVLEQFDGYTAGAPENNPQGNLGEDLDRGYHSFLRSSFIGIRS